MESFLQTNCKENSFLFLTISNKYFKRCPAMERCKNSLECFEYYAEIIEYYSFNYNIAACVEKYPTNESYHLHLLFDPNSYKYNKDDPSYTVYDLLHYAEQHSEQYANSEWKTSVDKYDNPTIEYGPSFKLKIVNTIENVREVINYINKEKSEKDELFSRLCNLLITRFCNKKMSRAQFMKDRMFNSQKWKDFREEWRKKYFRYCYQDSLTEFINTLIFT